MIYLYGAGSRSILIYDLLKRKYKRTNILFTDDKKKAVNKNFIEKNLFLKKFNARKDKLIICISNPTSHKKRYKELKKKLNFKDLNPIVDKNVIIKNNVKLDKNTIILSGTNLGPNVKIEKNVFIGVNCIINHDSKIEKFTTVGHGSNIAGNTKIEENCFIGISSTIKNNLVIRKNVFIGSSSNVIKNCEPNSVYFGNPAKKQKND